MQNQHKRYLFLLYCMLLCTSLPAQRTEYHFDNYSSKDGLPSSEVYCLLRDRNNYLWFATDHGVCRYDGYSFQKIPLPDNTVFHIRQDADGLIWFGTYTGQLFYLKNDKPFPYKYNNTILTEFKNQIITDFVIARDSTVYISFMTGGSVKIDAAGRITKRTSDKARFSITQVDSVFFTSISNSGKDFKQPVDIELSTSASHSRFLMNTTVLWARKHKAFRSANGNLLTYAGKYLIVINKQGGIHIQELPFDILSIAEDSDGDLWVGCMYEGVVLMSWEKEKGYTIRSTHLQGVSVTDITQDHEGGIWLTSLEKGVFYLRSKYLYFLSPDSQKLDYRISSLASINDSLLLMGTRGKGLLCYNPNNKRFIAIPLPGNFDNMFYDSLTHRVLALGSEFGALSVIQALMQSSHGLQFIMTEGNSNFLKWQNHNYLLGRHSGIFSLDGNTGTLKKLNEDVFRVGWLQKDPEGNLLVANQYGLWKYQDNNFIPYNNTHPLLSKRITCMQWFADKILCMGTRGEGLLLKIGDSVHRITEEQGLVNNNIRRILVSENNILLATNKGLSKVHVHSLDPFQFSIQNLGFSEGLFVSEVNDINRLNGILYIASDIGLAFVEEDKVFREMREPTLPFHFTDLKINDHTVEWQSSYTLSHRQRDITIAYTALSFRDPSGIWYRYRILGMDTTWIYTKAREIRLTSMPYGDFTVEFQAASRLGKWFSADRLLQISIEPPLWKRRWFILLIAATAILILYGWTRRTILQIKKREKEKTEYNKRMAEMEIRSLRAQMNPHFTFNVMQSIQYYITHHDFDAAQRYLGKFSKLMRTVLDNSRFAYITLFDETETLKDYLDLEKLRFEKELRYTIEVQSGLDLHAIKIPTMLIQPYVENAVKHGLSSQKNNPMIEILINIKNGYLMVDIRDNGIGRKKSAELAAKRSEKHLSAGTSLVAERIEAFNKYYGYGLQSETIDLYDDLDRASGTKVILTIPLLYSHDKSTTG